MPQPGTEKPRAAGTFHVPGRGRYQVLRELDSALSRERETSQLLSVSQSQAEALLQTESQRKQQSEVISAECDELRRLLESACNERDDLMSTLSKAQDEVAALDKVHSDASNNQQFILDLQKELEKLRIMIESLVAEKDRQLREYSVNVEELKDNLANVTADYDHKLSNLCRDH